VTQRVLFLCTGNSARSIIAEALLKSIGGEDFEVFSAGTHPSRVNPLTIQVLELALIDATGAASKPVADFEGQEFDYVITVCDSAAEECPVFPGKTQRLHWSFPDPATITGSDAERLRAFQETLDGMRVRISDFIRGARG
jgi:arsenate reductase